LKWLRAIEMISKAPPFRAGLIIVVIGPTAAARPRTKANNLL
jgi:hypothetical protein